MYVILNILASFWNNEQNSTNISVNVQCALLGHYAANSGNSLPKFRDNISVPPSRVKKPKRTPVTLVCFLYSEGCGWG